MLAQYANGRLTADDQPSTMDDGRQFNPQSAGCWASPNSGNPPFARPGVLVVGIGNDFRKDDATGLVVARKLREFVPRDEVHVIECTGGSFELIDMWEGARTVIIVDAVSSGAGPGTIFRIEGHKQPVPSCLFQYSTHGFSIAETIELATLLGKLPPKLVLFGVEGADFGQGQGLSEEVADAIERVIPAVESLVMSEAAVHLQVCTRQPEKEK